MLSRESLEYLQLRLPVIFGLGFPKSQEAHLLKYLEFLWASNEELNLFSRQMSFQELIDNHVIDCLISLPHFPKEAQKIADFGSGGGLPAILFALAMPERQFTLFEKSAKKRFYLEKLKAFAPNIILEGMIPETLSQYDLITARAFKPVDVIVEMSRSYCQKGGKYFLLKGRLEKIEEELLLARKKIKNLKVNIFPLSSPVISDVQRHLVMIN